jgi:hypothetical protein
LDAKADASAPARRRGRRGAEPRFGALLVSLVGAFLLLGFDQRWTNAVAAALLAVALVVSVVPAVDSRLASGALVAAAAAAVALTWLAPVRSPAYGAGQLISLIDEVAIIAVVGGVLLRQDEVDVQTVFGAVSTYLLIGFAFSSVYGLLDSLAQPLLFGHPVRRSVYSYFSFTTLTTVGFGDFTARTDVGRRFVMLEAITGQLFIATVLARLVANFRRTAGRRRRRRRARRGEPGAHPPGSPIGGEDAPRDPSEAAATSAWRR